MKDMTTPPAVQQPMDRTIEADTDVGGTPGVLWNAQIHLSVVR